MDNKLDPELTKLLIALATSMQGSPGADPLLSAGGPPVGSQFSTSQNNADKYPGTVQPAPMAKVDPITDPGGGTGGNPPDSGPNPGENPYDQDFPIQPGAPGSEYGPGSPWMYPTWEEGMDNATGGGGDGGGGGGGGGLPLSWLDKVGMGASVTGTVGEMLKPHYPGRAGGDGGLTKIDPVSLYFMIKQARGQ